MVALGVMISVMQRPGSFLSTTRLLFCSSTSGGQQYVPGGQASGRVEEGNVVLVGPEPMTPGSKVQKRPGQGEWEFSWHRK